ncbi:MAG: hypothetical protein HQK49_02070 [Oligoflexia bacterium]|nr:hypothetical protein [Oligoflexia bacterium]
MNLIFSKRGQALIEYMIILSVMALVSVKAVQNIRKALNSSMGSLSSVISKNLTVGVCGKNKSNAYCFFNGYTDNEDEE